MIGHLLDPTLAVPRPPCPRAEAVTRGIASGLVRSCAGSFQGETPTQFASNSTRIRNLTSSTPNISAISRQRVKLKDIGGHHFIIGLAAAGPCYKRMVLNDRKHRVCNKLPSISATHGKLGIRSSGTSESADLLATEGAVRRHREHHCAIVMDPAASVTETLHSLSWSTLKKTKKKLVAHNFEGSKRPRL